MPTDGVRIDMCDQPLSEWMQEGCKVFVDSYATLNGSCFMITWTILENHLWEVGLTQNWETVVVWTLTTVDLLYFIMYVGPR